jgi:hypothetical protein
MNNMTDTIGKFVPKYKPPHTPINQLPHCTSRNCKFEQKHKCTAKPCPIPCPYACSGRCKSPGPCPNLSVIEHHDALNYLDQYTKDIPGTCKICGCTDLTACPDGCAWTDDTRTLCTACAAKTSSKTSSNNFHSENH